MNDDIVVQATLETVLNTAQLSWVTPPVLTMSYTSSVSDESWCRPHHVMHTSHAVEYKNEFVKSRNQSEYDLVILEISKFNEGKSS